jgi:succinate dehydrogenase / fumarate reductase membrane anchor subunit
MASKTSLRTPLGRVRGLGSAKDGTHHWWMQRVTAIALIPLRLIFVAMLPMFAAAGYEGFVTMMRDPLVATLMALIVIAGIYHMKLGVQVVIEDYVHHEGVKTAMMLALTLGSFALAAASLVSILQLAL